MVEKISSTQLVCTPAQTLRGFVKPVHATISTHYVLQLYICTCVFTFFKRFLKLIQTVAVAPSLNGDENQRIRPRVINIFLISRSK